MIKTTLIVSFLLMNFINITHGQVVIPKDSLAKVGDIYTFSGIYNLINNIPVGNKGENQIWDYSNLIGDTTLTIQYVDPKESRGADKFPGSTIAEDDGNQILYYQLNTNSINLLGRFDTIPVIFNPPLLYQNLPITFGNTSTSKSIASIKTINPQRAQFPSIDSVLISYAIEKTDTVDGYGTLSLPNGTFNALRIVSYSKEVVTVKGHFVGTPSTDWINIPNAGQVNNFKDFIWLTPTVGAEILRIKTVLNNPDHPIVNIKWFTKNTPTSIAKKEKLQMLNLSPNPNGGVFTLINASNKMESYYFSIISNVGTVISTGKVNTNETLNFQNLYNGIYTIAFTKEDGSESICQKLVIENSLK